MHTTYTTFIGSSAGARRGRYRVNPFVVELAGEVAFLIRAEGGQLMSQNAETTLVGWAGFLSSHDADRFLSLFTDDCVYEDVAFGVVNRVKRELRTFIEGIFGAFPDFRIDLKSHFVAGEWAAMEWVMTGTHEGDLAGMPATHKRFSIRGASVVEFNSAQIKRISDYWDLATFLKQLGLTPSV